MFYISIYAIKMPKVFIYDLADYFKITKEEPQRKINKCAK